MVELGPGIVAARDRRGAWGRARPGGALMAAVIIAVLFACAAGAGSAGAAVGDLSYSGCFGSIDPNHIGPTGCTAAVGPSGADSVAVSPDGSSVYVTGFFGNALTVLHRDSDGQLIYDQCWGNPDKGTGIGPTGCNPALGLGGASAVAVSPDGNNVYVTGVASNGLAIFHRADNGDLSYTGCVGNPDANTGIGPAGCQPALGLGGAEAVTVSPDGSSVYVAGAISNGVAVLHRASDGSLTYTGCVGNPDANTGIGPAGCQPALGLGGADAVAVSPDGESVYVTGVTSNGMAMFTRAADGSLSYTGCVGNPDAGTGIGPAGCTPALGLGSASSVAVSPDGSSVYVSGAASNGVAILHRTGTGALTDTGCMGNPDAGTGIGPAGCQPALGLGHPTWVTVSPDGASVYASGLRSNGIAVMHRAADGSLSYTGCVGNPDAGTGIGPAGCTPALGLGGVEGLAVSPDGASLYAAGFESNALSVMNRVPGTSSSGGSSGGGTSGGGSPPTTQRTATVGNQKISLSSTSSNACLAHSATFQATFSANAIIGSTAVMLTFVKARVYIDRGVRHVSRHQVRRHGRLVSVKTVTYTPNRTVHKLPADLSFSLSKLHQGNHTLKVAASFHETVHGHVKTVTKTLRRRFSVCGK